MAYPSVRSSSYGVATYSSGWQITAPADIEAGDTIWVTLFAFTGDGTVSALEPASGWTEKFDTALTADSWQGRLGGYYKKAVGDEDGTTLTIATQATRDVCRYICDVVKDAADPTVTAPAAATPATGLDSTTVNYPSLTPGGGAIDYYWLSVAGNFVGQRSAYPSDCSLNQITTWDSTNEGGLFQAGQQLNAASEDCNNATIGANGSWVATQVAFFPVSTQTVTLGLLSCLTLYAPTVKPTVTLPLLSAATVHQPTLVREEVVTLPLIEALTVYAPTVRSSITLPLLAAATVYQPTLVQEQPVTLPLLAAATLYAPTVVAESLITLPLLSTLTVYAPTVTYGDQYLTLPLLSALTIYAPTIEGSLVLPLLSTLSIFEPTLVQEQPVVLPLISAATLYAPTVESTVTLPLLTACTLHEPTVRRCQWITVNADASKGSWDSSPTPGQALYAQVDELAADDGDFIFETVT